jgi:hypothetical protein
LTKLEMASESPELAVSVSANVPPVVFALDALLRTSACGTVAYDAPSVPLA